MIIPFDAFFLKFLDVMYSSSSSSGLKHKAVGNSTHFTEPKDSRLESIMTRSLMKHESNLVVSASKMETVKSSVLNLVSRLSFEFREEWV